MRRLVVGFICLLLVSCIQTTSNEVQQPEYGVIVVGPPSYFDNVKTFAWHPVAAKAFLDSKNDGRRAIDLYRESIESRMVGKGYQHIDSITADVIVSFGLAQESELSDETLYKGTSLSTGVQTFYHDHKKAEKGSIYIVFFRQNLTIPDWKVLAQGAMLPKMTTEEMEVRANEIVSMMLRKVPSK